MRVLGIFSAIRAHTLSRRKLAQLRGLRTSSVATRKSMLTTGPCARFH